MRHLKEKWLSHQKFHSLGASFYLNINAMKYNNFSFQGDSVNALGVVVELKGKHNQLETMTHETEIPNSNIPFRNNPHQK